MAGAAALPGCQPTGVVGPARGGIFTEAVAGTVGYLNPLFADEDNSREISSLVFQGLFTAGTAGQPAPLLASGYTLSDDRRTYTVDLRTDVKWADGAPFGVDDVVYTFGVLQDPNYAQPEAAVWKGVGVKATGDAQVQFSLKAPSAAFLYSLRIGILPHHLFGEDVAQIPLSPRSGAKALGTGPFLVEAISQDRTVVTLRRNAFARPAPLLDRIVFHGYPRLSTAVAAVASGQADAVGGSFEGPDLEVLKKAGLKIHVAQTETFTAILFNFAKDAPFFGDTSVRHALSLAIDREGLVRRILGGRAEVARGPLPPSSWAYSADAVSSVKYDPTAAAAALDEAGWRLPRQGLLRTRDGADLLVRLTVPDAYPYRQVADEVRHQLAAIGVGIRLEPVPVHQLVQRFLVAHTYQAAMAAFDNGPDPDQFSFWHSSQKGYPLNFSGLPRQSFIDKDLEDGREGTDHNSRQPAYTDLQTLIVDATPAVFLYEPLYEYAVASRVHGVDLPPALEPVDRFAGIAQWSVR